MFYEWLAHIYGDFYIILNITPTQAEPLPIFLAKLYSDNLSTIQIVSYKKQASSHGFSHCIVLYEDRAGQQRTYFVEIICNHDILEKYNCHPK